MSPTEMKFLFLKKKKKEIMWHYNSVFLKIDLDINGNRLGTIYAF